MTGEMGYDDLKDYPQLFELAKKISRSSKFGTAVKPFDQYQGAFIAVSFDKDGKFVKDGRKFSSWNAQVWTSENPDEYIIVDRERDRQLKEELKNVIDTERMTPVSAELYTGLAVVSYFRNRRKNLLKKQGE